MEKERIEWMGLLYVCGGALPVVKGVKQATNI